MSRLKGGSYTPDIIDTAANMWLRSEAVRDYGATEHVGLVSKLFKVRRFFQTFNTKGTSNDRPKKSISSVQIEESIENHHCNEGTTLILLSEDLSMSASLCDFLKGLSVDATSKLTCFLACTISTWFKEQVSRPWYKTWTHTWICVVESI